MIVLDVEDGQKLFIIKYWIKLLIYFQLEHLLPSSKSVIYGLSP